MEQRSWVSHLREKPAPPSLGFVARLTGAVWSSEVPAGLGLLWEDTDLLAVSRLPGSQEVTSGLAVYL